LTSAQIGRIDVHPHVSYVAVQRSAIKSLLQQVGGEKIKGMKTLIEEMRK
ncbi:MAG: DbpA RNA binding domain-containing protein, partial [Bacteroidaceae bacterium]|nr:DbpA RNA binding domain-containing protein [Bacteroidaceae bacterium]